MRISLADCQTRTSDGRDRMSKAGQFVGAMLLITVGGLLSIFRIRKYLQYPNEALKEDLVEIFVYLFPEILFDLGILVLGFGWIIYLVFKA
jgi:hypothetical protein